MFFFVQIKLTNDSFQQEKDKYNQMVLKFQREMTELQAALYEEGQNRTRLQMELDAKDSENEQLQARMALQNSDTASVNSSGQDAEDDGMLGNASRSLPRAVLIGLSALF